MKIMKNIFSKCLKNDCNKIIEEILIKIFCKNAEFINSEYNINSNKSNYIFVF